VVDALDECWQNGPTELNGFLRLVLTASKCSSKVRWLISSNYNEEVAAQFTGGVHHLDLDLYSKSNCYHHDIKRYIDGKVSRLAIARRYSIELELAIAAHLIRRFSTSYLLINMICSILANADAWNVIQLNNRWPSTAIRPSIRANQPVPSAGPRCLQSSPLHSSCSVSFTPHLRAM
jgi:hypothetical protein